MWVYVLFLTIVIVMMCGFMFRHIYKIQKNQFQYYMGMIQERKGQFESIKHSVTTLGVPIIKMTIFGERYNFLLDTGGDHNYFDKSVLDKIPNLNITLSKGQDFVTTGNSTVKKTSVGNLPLSYNKQLFDEEFTITDMSESFDLIEKADGVRIHGILGSMFFTKYQWSLDFEKMVVWTGK